LADGAALLDRYAAALARQPWLAVLPAAVAEALPVRRESDTWFLRDAAAKLLPCHPGFIETWRLLACSGGSPLTVFGEWNGQQFWPLSSWRDGQLTAF